MDYGNERWIWHENGEPLGGQNSFNYFSTKEKAEKFLENYTKK